MRYTSAGLWLLLASLAALPAAAQPRGLGSPDLVIKRVTLARGTDQRIHASLVIKNIGNAAAPTCKLNWYWARDFWFWTPGSESSWPGIWAVTDVPAVPAGAETTVQFTETYNQSATAQFVFLVDAPPLSGGGTPLGAVNEVPQLLLRGGGAPSYAGETNNAFVVPGTAEEQWPRVFTNRQVEETAPVRVSTSARLKSRPTYPDLVVDQVLLEWNKVTVTIRNLGTALANANLGVLEYHATGVNRRPLLIGLVIQPGQTATTVVDRTSTAPVTRYVFWVDPPRSGNTGYASSREIIELEVRPAASWPETNNVFTIPVVSSWTLPMTFRNSVTP
jgi:hypothetical protein